jgi:hypothetical protein
MQHQDTAPEGALQVFDRQRARRKYDWLNTVRKKLRGEHGREICKQHNVCPRLVAELADQISGYPSFKEHGETWAGQQGLGLRLGVQARQVRRAVGALCELDLLRVERGRRGNTNKMRALLHGRPLFEPNAADDRSPPSGSNGTCMSAENRTQASSNPLGEEAEEVSDYKETREGHGAPACAYAPDLLPSQEAFELAAAYRKAVGIDPDDPQWDGLPYTTQVWVTRGYDGAAVLAFGSALAGRYGRKPMRYHAKAVENEMTSAKKTGASNAQNRHGSHPRRKANGTGFASAAIFHARAASET